MAERRVSTRFAVEGESQYKAALKSISSEMKVLDSELKLANSSLKANGASIDTLKAKQQALTNVIAQLEKKIAASKAQTDKAKQAQQQWAQKAEAARQKLKELESTTDDAGKETDEYRQKVAEIQAEINRYEAAEQKAKTAVEAHTAETNNAQAKQNQYQGELHETENALNELGNASQRQGEKSESMFATWAKGALTLTAVITVIRKLADGLKECIKASIEYEDAFAGVEKTVDASTAQLRQMSEEIRQLATEIPATAEEIAHVAEAAGQLGIATSDIMGFTEVMIALGVSTNMTADEAATSLARFINITGLSASRLENLGSAIVALGNTTATTEKEIVDMGMNLAAAGKQAGLTDAEIMGIAAALSSVGLEASSGGTAFSRWMKDMQVAVETGSEKLETFASVAGMSAEEFASAWESSPIDALNAFFKGLGNGTESAIVLLEEMGVTNVRTSDTAIRLANAGNLLANSVAKSTSAFEENIALTTEAEKRYETTKSKIQVMNNTFHDLGITVGDNLSPATNFFIDSLTELAEWLKTDAERGKMWGDALLNAKDTVDGLTAASRNLNDAMKSSDEAYKDTSASIEATDAIAQGYIARLKELEGQTSLTKDEEIERQAITKQLLALIPELSTVINEETLEIEGGTAALEVNTQAWVDNAKARAQQDYLESKTKAYSDAVAELTANEVDLWIAKKNLKEAQDAEAKYLDENAAALQSTGKEYLDAATTATGLALAVTEAQEQVDALTEAVETGQEAVDGYKTEAEQTAEALTAMQEAANGAGEAIGEFTEDEEGIISYLKEASARVEELVKKYQEMGEAAVAGAEQTAGGLLSVVEVVEASSQDVIAALQSQTEFFNQYAENIKAAAEHGLNEGLVAALSNGSMESAQILAGLAAEGWTNINELNAAFEATQTGKAALEKNVQEANATAEGELQAIVDNVNAMVDEFNKAGEATSAGVETINGYVSGLNSNISGVSAAVTQINNAINKIIRDVSVSVNVHTNYTSSGKQGGKATGLPYVPYDEFNINLHKGEMVLTALQAEALKAQQRADRYGAASTVNNASVQNSNVRYGDVTVQVQMGGVMVREEADASRISEAIAEQTARKLRYRGSSLMGGRL